MDSSDSGRIGLFNVAWALSIFGLVVCVLGWGLLAALMMPGADAEVSQGAQRYMASMLAVLSVLAPMLHLTCRIMRGQRRIEERLAQLPVSLADLPADNVTAFTLGRNAGRADRTAPTLLPR